MDAHRTMTARDPLRAELLAELKAVTLLLRAALLCTSVEVVREARPFLDKADTVIARAEVAS